MKHIAWDFDGTIIDSFLAYKKVMLTYCHDNDLSIPNDAEMRLSFGDTDWKGFSVWDMPFDLQDKHRYLAYDQFYLTQKNNPDALPAIPEVIAVINNLGRKGYIQSIVTSRPRQMLMDMAEHLGIKDKFQLFNTGDCAEELHLKDKPAPDKLLYVMSKLLAKPDETMMIGDTIMDIGMAKNAGVRSIAVTWGMGSEKDLKEAGADTVLSTPSLLEKTIHALQL